MPAERGFLTKPQLVIEMLDRALAAGVPFRYFTADSGYGRDPGLRARCHAAALSYVLAVPVDLPLVEPGGGATRPDRVLRHGADSGVGAPLLRCGHQGRRFYDWAAVAVTVKDQPPADGYAHTLLIRRSVADPSEIEFFLAHAPEPTPIPRADRRRRDALEDRGEQRPGQGPARPRPVPGPQVDPLAPARERLHAGPRLPRRHPRASLGKDHPPREVPAR